MSYDLLLFRRPDHPPLTYEDFIAFFNGRENYETDEEQAYYSNPDTGIYFTFYFSDGIKEEEDEEEEGAEQEQLPHLYFNMNYFRPHVFGLEAAHELELLVDELDLIVSDSQMEGMGDGEFSEEGFLRGWNAGNRFAHSALMALGSRSESSKPVYDLPRETIRAYWEWNFYRDEIGEDLALDDYDVFVPRVFFVEQDGQVRSIAMWPEAIPTALPVVDLVLLSRYELLDIEEEDEESSDAVAIVTWDELRGVTKDFEMVKDPDDPMPDYLILSYEELPEAIHQWLCDRPGLTERVTQISIGDVLDRELIEEVQKEGSE